MIKRTVRGDPLVIPGLNLELFSHIPDNRMLRTRHASSNKDIDARTIILYVK